MHPEAKHGGVRIPGKYNNNKNMQDPNSGSCSFIDATAKATGKGRTTVSRDAERGEKINGKALDVLSARQTNGCGRAPPNFAPRWTAMQGALWKLREHSRQPPGAHARRAELTQILKLV